MCVGCPVDPSGCVSSRPSHSSLGFHSSTLRAFSAFSNSLLWFTLQSNIFKIQIDQVTSFHWLSIIRSKKRPELLGIKYKASPDLAFFLMSFSGLFPTSCSLPSTACYSTGLSLSTTDIWGWIVLCWGAGLSCAMVICSAASLASTH